MHGCIKMAPLISKGIMHSTELGINFLAMQIQYVQYHQKPHCWAHLWTFIKQTAWKYFHHLHVYNLVLKARIYWCDFFHYKSCLHNYIKTSVAYFTNAWWRAHTFPSMKILSTYPSVSNHYSILLFIRKNSASYTAAKALMNVKATFSSTPMCVV